MKMDLSRNEDRLPTQAKNVLDAVEELWPESRDGLEGGIPSKRIAEEVPIGYSTVKDQCTNLLRAGHLRAAWGVGPNGPRLSYVPVGANVIGALDEPNPREEDRCPECGKLITVGSNGTEYGHQSGSRRGSDSCPERPDDEDLEVVA